MCLDFDIDNFYEIAMSDDLNGGDVRHTLQPTRCDRVKSVESPVGIIIFYKKRRKHFFFCSFHSCMFPSSFFFFKKLLCKYIYICIIHGKYTCCDEKKQPLVMKICFFFFSPPLLFLCGRWSMITKSPFGMGKPWATGKPDGEKLSLTS